MRNTVRQGEWREGTSLRQLQDLVNQSRAALNYRETIKKSVQTVLTATVTEIWSEPMPTNALWLVSADVLALATDGDAAFYRRVQRYNRGSSGAPTLVRSTTPIADDEDVAGWDITFAAATDGTISLSVTGDATRTIDWSAWIEVMER